MPILAGGNVLPGGTDQLKGNPATIANSAAVDVATLVTNFNALLVALRARGVIS